MILWHKREARPLEPKRINTKRQELQAAKEILAEIFHARPKDIEDMIKSRLEERWAMEQTPISGELWPETLCLGE